jgi:hypothetical protein
VHDRYFTRVKCLGDQPSEQCRGLRREFRRFDDCAVSFAAGRGACNRLLVTGGSHPGLPILTAADVGTGETPIACGPSGTTRAPSAGTGFSPSINVGRSSILVPGSFENETFGLSDLDSVGAAF